MPAAHRLQLVVEHVDPQPSDHVVEVGCGHGVAATLVLERVTTGRYTGVDRSARMIVAAERRNRAAVGDGRARFVLGSFAHVDLGGERADRVFAARVASMARPDELDVAMCLLAPGGVLVLSFDAPSGPTAAIVDGAAVAMTAAGFVRVIRIESADREAPAFVVGVRA